MDNSSRIIGDFSDGAVVDVAADSLAKYVAACGDNGAVRVYDNPTMTTVATFGDQGGAAVRVAWAHHRFGGVLLVLTEAGDVVVWTEASGTALYECGASAEPQQWTRKWSQRLPAPGRAAAWAPVEFGPMFAAACGNGQVYIFSCRTADFTQFDVKVFQAHQQACNAVSWCPCLAPGAVLSMPMGVSLQQQPGVALPPPRIVTGGDESAVRVWRYLAQDQHWIQEHELPELGLTQPAIVNDVAWAPNAGIPFSYIAAGSEHGTVCVWLQDGVDGRWNSVSLPPMGPVCRLSWSQVGSVLCATSADGASTMWKEAATGEWRLLHRLQN
jgi:WD40 repeat protein